MAVLAGNIHDNDEAQVLRGDCTTDDEAHESSEVTAHSRRRDVCPEKKRYKSETVTEFSRSVRATHRTRAMHVLSLRTPSVYGICWYRSILPVSWYPIAINWTRTKSRRRTLNKSLIYRVRGDDPIDVGMFATCKSKNKGQMNNSADDARLRGASRVFSKWCVEPLSVDLRTPDCNAQASAGIAKGKGMYITGKTGGEGCRRKLAQPLDSNLDEGTEWSIDLWNGPSWNTVCRVEDRNNDGGTRLKTSQQELELEVTLWRIWQQKPQHHHSNNRQNSYR